MESDSVSHRRFLLALVALITLFAQLFYLLFPSPLFSGSLMTAKCMLINRLNALPPSFSFLSHHHRTIEKAEKKLFK